MINPKTQLATEAAALGRVIAHLEEVLGQTKQRYWAKVEELHSLEDTGPDAVAEAAEFARWRAGIDRGDDSFTVAKGAVTCDDT